MLHRNNLAGGEGPARKGGLKGKPVQDRRCARNCKAAARKRAMAKPENCPHPSSAPGRVQPKVRGIAVGMARGGSSEATFVSTEEGL
jgi:hypothetical protein